MCGIFAVINETPQFTNSYIQVQFEKGRNRGPEDSKFLSLGYEIKMGFHRLAINGLNSVSNQPFFIDNIALICNGEIYNYKELFHQLNITPITQSDCEIIIHLYKLFGIEQTLKMLDGVFSFMIYDMRIVEGESSKIYIARDPLGVRPLYILFPRTKSATGFFAIASELKMLAEMYNHEIIKNGYSLDQFTPGTYCSFEKSSLTLSRWKETIVHKPYFMLNHCYSLNADVNLNDEFEWAMSGIRKHLYNAVKKRYLSTERPIACLLSGGLDSSLITSLVCEIHKQENMTNPIETYSIGLENSEDLRYAKIVAEYLGTKHTEIVVTEKEMIDSIPEVIRTIESYDTTTVRASIGNYLLGKYIAQHSDAKVIFNGDGSDELCGGYLYMGKAPDAVEFDKEIRRLLTDIHLYDVLRSDKCISSHGLEPRTPFLDKNFVNFYMSIPVALRMHTLHGQCEKYLLRKSFHSDSLLPDSILWRTKEAFSDGVSNHGRSLYQIIQENVPKFNSVFVQHVSLRNHNLPVTGEQRYYRFLFDSCYPNLGKIVPYFWMPKYIEASDPSARTLSIYNIPSSNV